MNDQISENDLLRRVLVGEVPATAPEVQSRRHSDPEFARALDESLAMQSLLDFSDARDERTALDKRRGSKRWPLVLVAATFLALLVIPRLYSSVRNRTNSAAGPEAVMLGERADLQALSPSGTGQSFQVFSFEATLPPGSRGGLRIWGAGTPIGDAPLLEKRFDGTQCSLTDDEQQRLGEEIRWEVRLFDVDNKVIGVGRGRLGLALILLATPWVPRTHAQDTQAETQTAELLLYELSQRPWADLSDGERADWASEALALIPGVLQNEAPPEWLPGTVYGIILQLDSEPGPWSEALLELDPLPGARQLFVRADLVDHGASLDHFHATNRAHAGKLDEAGRLIRRALEVYLEEGLGRANLLLVRADLERMGEDWSASMRSLDAARELLDGLAAGGADDLYGMDVTIRRHGTQAQLEIDLGRVERAWQSLERGAELAEQFVATAPEEWQPIAAGAIDTSNYRRSELLLLTTRYEKLVEGLDRQSASYAAADVHLGMALAELEIESPDREPRARAILQAAIADPETTPNDRLSARLTLTYLNLAQGRPEAAAPTLASIEESFESVSTGPARIKHWAYFRVLLLRAARLRGETGEELEDELVALEQALDPLLESWRKAPLLEGGLGFLRLGRRVDILGELLAGAEARGQLERALPRLFEAECQGSLARTLGARAPELAAVRSTLVEAGGILIYVPTRTATHVVAIDQRGTAYARTAGGREVEGLVAGLEVALALAPALSDPEVEAASRALGRELLPAPLIERIGTWSHVYVVGSGLFDQPPPFELLPLEGEPLGRAKPLAYLPSIALGVDLAGRLGPRAPQRPGDAVVVASPPPGEAARKRWPELAPLPVELNAAERLGDGFLEPFVLEGPGATRSALEAAPLESARLLHVFGHGAHDASLLLPQCLVLAEDREGVDDGLLFSDAVRELPAPELVVLSACGAAWGKQRSGEDASNHLGGAFFFAAGAASVLLAGVELEAGATLRTAERFQAALVEGHSVAESLRGARASAPPGDALTAARIFALGAAHRPLFEPVPRTAPGPWLWWAAGGGLLLAAGWLGVRRRAG